MDFTVQLSGVVAFLLSFRRCALRQAFRQPPLGLQNPSLQRHMLAFIRPSIFFQIAQNRPDIAVEISFPLSRKRFNEPYPPCGCVKRFVVSFDVVGTLGNADPLQPRLPSVRRRNDCLSEAFCDPLPRRLGLRPGLGCPQRANSVLPLIQSETTELPAPSEP